MPFDNFMQRKLSSNIFGKQAALLLLTLLCFFSILPSALSLSVVPPMSVSTRIASDTFKRQLGPDTTMDPLSYTCEVVGECLACSTLQIQTENVCKETHNRQRIECHYVDPRKEEDEDLKLKLPTYRSCLHVKAVEARKFAHFFSMNVFLAFFSGLLLVWRKRKLAAAQYRRMARRIGIA
ncbi:hypothetical protein BCR41DRAFT_150433 [Lobosporangium transversale]|uniref:Protein JTB n=1 Tax=Lobosporangium transversale TaxID=64571 RepID=A0A1Y2GDX5_9FUNG|nr:hypothetical protein BCR41DRAFT_150433 [Lobosporangium transversale]ORZ08049.1 hypothetical protein BCR41DRAFT_150433 [Lobosporangium transversale]|eukprot:XP_021878283.1 hypothetical protein BCR41DRAFT_150433 [Lobosporangium transversale]